MSRALVSPKGLPISLARNLQKGSQNLASHFRARTRRVHRLNPGVELRAPRYPGHNQGLSSVFTLKTLSLFFPLATKFLEYPQFQPRSSTVERTNSWTPPTKSRRYSRLKCNATRI